jgi:hypothetical protein
MLATAAAVGAFTGSSDNARPYVLQTTFAELEADATALPVEGVL